MDSVLEIIRDGVRVRIEIDMQSAIISGVVIFLALVLALTFYGKVIR